MNDEEKHTKVMVALAEINITLLKVVKPAVDQVYVNKTDIIIIKNNAKHTKDNKSRFMSYIAMALSLAVTVLCFLRLYKPPHIPH